MAALTQNISLVLCLTLLTIFSPCKSSIISINPNNGQPPLLYLPVRKDADTLQYVTVIQQRTPPVSLNLTLDLGGRQLWVDCDLPYVSSTYSPARCGSPHCSLVADSRSCFNDCFFQSQPGCYNDTCGLVVDNSVAGIVTGGEVGMDVIYVQAPAAMRGISGMEMVSVPEFLFTCGASFLLEGLADGVSGMAGLGRTNMSFPSQFSAASSGGMGKTFSLCLGPTTGAVLFAPPAAGSDVANSLVFTPLLTNPVSTATCHNGGEASSEYFVRVKSIKVNGTPVKVNATLLSIDEQGRGGTKISTVDPYTVLESSIYDAVLNAFVEASGKYNMTRISSVGPFGACFNASGIRITRYGPAVPRIEVEFENGVAAWRILGANSMVRVGEAVTCLGLVDGGANPRTAVVFGGHQLEDNLVVFDMERSRVGLSGSMLGRGRSCAGFVDRITTMGSYTGRDLTL
ncbi:unnamed protein product [Linum trigynum]|uniref:Peptidase A1 domain-containing protein n=1 Tax=Linum trigynum TaxID=586398 RepID=A0AAV2FHF0_9ROSI